MRQPQFGVPAPSMPSLPSVDKIPSEADIARLSGSTSPMTFPTEAASFTGTPSLSPLSASVPSAGTLPSQPALPHSATSLTSASPFSLPLPDFDLPFPNFESSLPTIPPLAALGTEDGQ
jgi:cysteine desulfurase/selenocysteine lyase